MAHQGLGQLVVGTLGEIVLKNSGGDGFRLAAMASVGLAHHALEFGEFPHHLGDQICLAQVGGALDMLARCSLYPKLVSNAGGDGFDALHLGGHGTQPFLKGDGFQLGDEVF